MALAYLVVVTHPKLRQLVFCPFYWHNCQPFLLPFPMFYTIGPLYLCYRHSGWDKIKKIFSARTKHRPQRRLFDDFNGNVFVPGWQGALNVVVNQELYEKLDAAETQSDEIVFCSQAVSFETNPSFESFSFLPNPSRFQFSMMLCEVRGIADWALGVPILWCISSPSQSHCWTLCTSSKHLHTTPFITSAMAIPLPQGTFGSPCASCAKRCGSHCGCLMGLWASNEAPSASVSRLISRGTISHGNIN